MSGTYVAIWRGRFTRYAYSSGRIARLWTRMQSREHLVTVVRQGVL
jgi:hypothetical protein